MRTLAAIGTLARIDSRIVGRDPLLVWAVTIPVATSLGLRALDEWGASAVRGSVGFDIRPWYPVLAGYAWLVMTPMLIGFVVGFAILDERDDRTLGALLVTPLPASLYILYRAGLPLLACTTVTLLCQPVAGMIAVGWAVRIGATVVASLGAVLLALALGTFAADKVQGFALTKAVSSLMMAPLAAFFVPTPWGDLAGVVPTYWPLKAMWLAAAGDSGAGTCLAIGLAFHIGLLLPLLRGFGRALRR